MCDRPETRLAVAALKAQADCCDGLDHFRHAGEECLGTAVRWNRLIERYVNTEIGICLDVHARFPSIDSERRDLTFVFQKSPGADIK